MRKLAPFLLLCAVSCGGLGQVSFDVDQSGTTTVQGGPGIPFVGGLDFGSFNFSQSQAFTNSNTDKDHITSAHLKKLTLKVKSPAGATLSFLTKVDFFIEASGQQKVHIAGKNPIPSSATTVDLDVDDRDIATYAKASSVTITTEATGSAPNQNTDIEADLTLNIHASIL